MNGTKHTGHMVILVEYRNGCHTMAVLSKEKFQFGLNQLLSWRTDSLAQSKVIVNGSLVYCTHVQWGHCFKHTPCHSFKINIQAKLHGIF